MNGLDPAGMQDMREMILSLVAEGRTVVLSSHLLDEVERTCDAVAIVDRGRVVRQGPISELLAGASIALQIECSDPDRARALIAATAIGVAPRNRGHHRRNGARCRPGCGDRTRCDRRDQSSARRGWHLGLPAPGAPSITSNCGFFEVTSRLGENRNDEMT